MEFQHLPVIGQTILKQLFYNIFLFETFNVFKWNLNAAVYPPRLSDNTGCDTSIHLLNIHISQCILYDEFVRK